VSDTMSDYTMDTKHTWQHDTSEWLRRVGFFRDIDRVLMPVHVGIHWLLASLDLPKGDTPGSIDLYDSSFNKERLERVEATLRAFLRGVHESTNQAIPRDLKANFDPARWKSTIHAARVVPQQANDYDCGVFMFVFAAARASGKQPGPGGGGVTAPEWSFTGGDQARRLNAWLLQSMYLDSVADNSCPKHGLHLCSVA